MSGQFGQRTGTIYYYGPPEEDKKEVIKSDSTGASKKLNNGWSVSWGVNENGKVSINATKQIGRLAGVKPAGSDDSDNEAKIEFTLKTSEHRVALLKQVDPSTYYDIYTHQAKWIEVDDEQSRVSESFKEHEKEYKRQWPQSSILTPSEFVFQIIPSLEELLNQKPFDEMIDKISSEAANLAKPYNKNFIFGEDRRGRLIK